jgi:hypothetical protein
LIMSDLQKFERLKTREKSFKTDFLTV